MLGISTYGMSYREKCAIRKGERAEGLDAEVRRLRAEAAQLRKRLADEHWDVIWQGRQHE